MAATPQARLYRGTPANLRRLAAVLRRGDLVGVPTETVYGLAADATNAAACRAIFRAKRRPATDPLIVHLHDLRQLNEIAEADTRATRVAKAFWPGPLTLILPKRASIPSVVTSGGPTVAVRMPAHPLFRRLLKLCGRPLAAPSANPFGYVSPTTAEHVRAGLGSRIRYILDGGPCPIGVESTILDLRPGHRPTILRPGAITADELSAVLGEKARSVRRSLKRTEAAPAPGLLTRHYSPRTAVELHRDRLPTVALTEARVHFRRPNTALGSNDFVLSETGDGREAARRLFALLRELDRAGWKRLHVQLAPKADPLAEAINDRLRRAAARG
jgi:L-threonylcarbamoyladenylate synthase